MSVEKAGGDFHMRLRVVRALKGIDAATADLWSDATSSCGVKLDQGKRYVIYTPSGRRPDVAPRLRLWPRSSTPGEPDPELPPVPGRVYGRVARYDVDRIREFKSLDAIPSVRVALDRPAGRVIADQRPVGPVPVHGRAARQLPARGRRRTGPDAVDAGHGGRAGPRGLRRYADCPLACRARCRAGCRPPTASREPGLCPAAARRAGWQPPRATRRPGADDGCRRPVHVRGTDARTTTSSPSTRRAMRRPAGNRTRRPGSAARIARPRRGFASRRVRRSSWIARSCCRRLAGHAHVHGCRDVPGRLCPAGPHDTRDGDDWRRLRRVRRDGEAVRSAR